MTAIAIGNTTMEIKVPRNMKPGDFLQASETIRDTESLVERISNTTLARSYYHDAIIFQVKIPGRNCKFKVAIPKLAKPGDLISIALPREDPSATDGNDEVCA